MNYKLLILCISLSVQIVNADLFISYTSIGRSPAEDIDTNPQNQPKPALHVVGTSPTLQDILAMFQELCSEYFYKSVTFFGLDIAHFDKNESSILSETTLDIPYETLPALKSITIKVGNLTHVPEFLETLLKKAVNLENLRVTLHNKIEGDNSFVIKESLQLVQLSKIKNFSVDSDFTPESALEISNIILQMNNLEVLLLDVCHCFPMVDFVKMELPTKVHTVQLSLKHHRMISVESHRLIRLELINIATNIKHLSIFNFPIKSIGTIPHLISLSLINVRMVDARPFIRMLKEKKNVLNLKTLDISKSPKLLVHHSLSNIYGDFTVITNRDCTSNCIVPPSVH